MKKCSIVYLLMVALVLVLVCSQNGYAQTVKKKIKKSATKTEETVDVDEDSPAPSAGSKTVEVMVDGYGETLDAAKKDALYNAVQKVAGTLVDAETRVRNEAVIEDILTASNGFVSSNEVQNVQKEDGFFKVTLKAVVVRTVLSERLQAALKNTKKLDGASLAGMVETQMKSEDDGAKMLAKFLVEENFPYSCLKFDVEAVQVAKKGSTCELEAAASLSCDMPKYKEFSKKLVQLLDKIAVKKVKDQWILKSRVQEDFVRFTFSTFEEWNNEEQRRNLCFVNTDTASNLEQTVCDIYLLPPKAAMVLRLYTGIKPSLELKLLNKDGESLGMTKRNCTFKISPKYYSFEAPYHLMGDTPRNSILVFQPFCALFKYNENFKDSTYYARSAVEFTMSVRIPKADLGKLDRQEAAIIPPITGKQILEKVDFLLKKMDSQGGKLNDIDIWNILPDDEDDE